jgi:hypothetical protein
MSLGWHGCSYQNHDFLYSAAKFLMVEKEKSRKGDGLEKQFSFHPEAR